MYLIHGLACLYYNSLDELSLAGLGTLSSNYLDSLKILTDFNLLFRDTTSISDLKKYAHSVGFDRPLCDFSLVTLSSEDKQHMQLYNIHSIKYVINCYNFNCNFISSLSEHYRHPKFNLDAIRDNNPISKAVHINKNTSVKHIDKFLLEEVTYTSTTDIVVDTLAAKQDEEALAIKWKQDALAIQNRRDALALKVKQNALGLQHNLDSINIKKESDLNVNKKIEIHSKTSGYCLNGYGGIIVSFVSLALTVFVSKKD